MNIKFRTAALKYLTPVAAMLGSSAAFAEASARGTAITAAATAANTDIALAVSAVIAAAALLFGLGFIIGLLRK